MDDLLNQLLDEGFAHGESSAHQEGPSPNLRQQMLKPGADDSPGTVPMQLLQPGSFQSGSTTRSYCSSGPSSVEVVTNQDPWTGCRRETVIQQLGDKKYLWEELACPIAAKSITENFINMTREDLDKFLSEVRRFGCHADRSY